MIQFEQFHVCHYSLWRIELSILAILDMDCEIDGLNYGQGYMDCELDMINVEIMWQTSDQIERGRLGLAFGI